MSQLAEIRSNDPALAACTLQPYPQLSAHALFAAELPSVCPMDASEHGEQHIEKTGSSLLGGSVAAFVDKHCSDADGRVSRGGRLHVLRPLAGSSGASCVRGTRSLPRHCTAPL